MAEMEHVDGTSGETFTAFVEAFGDRLRQGLMAALGPDVGGDAASEALGYAWQNWERVQAMENPVGYFFVVGRNTGRRSMRRRPVFPTVSLPEFDMPHVEPGLPDALASLSERQRMATVLVHGGGWTYAELAEMLGLDRGTVKKHADRGLAKLRSALEVNLDA